MCIKFGNMFFSFIQFVEVFSIFSKKIRYMGGITTM